ncbi:dihydrofolate reductase [uncultured Sanguibacteroides sp.]|uniref:dihydrofolate reductase n=1 Tax=uncultured Sanguibacteroides sp. TaxID=1635151 RepID=UPI0025FCEA69|nr:dihydrofolate reductase [uncultured Sanguibacteroides sp.]
MVLSIIVAAAENNVIGRDNGLIWRLSGDLKHFKAITTGHTVVMGRKTFQSMGRALPNRRNIVISRNPAFVAEGCELADSIEKALELAKDEEEVFIIGGGTIYRELWDRADRLYLTVVHTACDGDTKIPPVDSERWEKEKQEDFPADEKNEFAYSFINYRRKKE